MISSRGLDRATRRATPRPRAGLRILLPVLPLLGAVGCGCIETPADRLKKLHVEDELVESLRVDPAPEAALPPDESQASEWDRDRWRSILQDMYRYLDRDRCAEVLADGNRVMSYRPPEDVQLELHILLARCFEKIGDKARAQEHKQKFIDGYRKLISSERFQKQGQIARRLHEGLKRLKEQAGKDIFQIEGEPPRVNVRLARRLGDAGASEILSDSLPDGATIYFSKDPQALEDDLAGPMGPRLAVQRDPEFGYYFAIEEPDPAGL